MIRKFLVLRIPNKMRSTSIFDKSGGGVILSAPVKHRLNTESLQLMSYTISW